MKVYKYFILLLITLILFAFAIESIAVQFDLGFGSVEKALKKIREANLSQIEARYYKKLGNEISFCIHKKYPALLKHSAYEELKKHFGNGLNDSIAYANNSFVVEYIDTE